MRTTKREIILGMLVCCALVSTVMAEKPKVLSDSKIGRHALVTRHNIALNKPDPLTPLSVGNGQFAFTADITGLQTFPEYHVRGMLLGTQSQWAWHSMPNPEGYARLDCCAVLAALSIHDGRDPAARDDLIDRARRAITI